MDEKEDFKKVIFEDYKEGFGEIVKLVDGLETVSEQTSEIFLESRQNVLNRSMDHVRHQQHLIEVEIKKFLAIKNSELYQLRKMERQLMEESKECIKARKKIDKNFKVIVGTVENKKSAISGH